MRFRVAQTLTILVFLAFPAAAGELVLPVFALNLEGRADDFWNSELYLTNSSDIPVQVELARFLPGSISKPTPCDLFMPPTRVVPPQSAVIWSAAGLATDLGCAQTARGGLVLRADGPVHVTSRLVHLAASEDRSSPAVLSGRGGAFEAIPMEQLPGAGSHLLPALMWHRKPCGRPAFDTLVGFTNPGPDSVHVVLDVPHETSRVVRANGRDVSLPYSIEIPPYSWSQLRLAPSVDDDTACGSIETFLAKVDIDGPLAIYASVIDRASGDPRTVTPIPLDAY